MASIKYLSIFLVIIVLLSGCGKKPEKILEPGVYAKMETNRGTFIIALEYKKVPMLVANFVGLAEGVFQGDQSEDSGFFNYTTFNDITRDVLIKGGVFSNTPKSLPGYYLPNNVHPELLHDRIGAVSMNNVDSQILPHQFLITLQPLPWLDYKQPVIGYVIDGLDVLKKITWGDILNKVTISRVGENAERFIINMENFTILRKDVERDIAESGQALVDDVIGTLKETYPDLVQTPEGVWFTIMKQGGGATPQVGTEATVKYTGTLLDGTVFMDTGKNEGGVEKLILGEAFKGLDIAVRTMRKGERKIVVLPPELGFGDAGLKPLIPPKAFLMFDIELIDF